MNKYPEITVDSRGCGSGKTYTYIYPLLARRAQRFERTLVVVAGILLQEQYKKAMRDEHGVDIVIINSNSDSDTTVVARVAAAMRNLDNTIVCITAQCWIRYRLELQTKMDWHLIIDEAIDPIRPIRYSRKNSIMNWESCFELRSDMPTSEYWEIGVDETKLDTWAETAEPIRMIQDSQWHTWASQNTLEQLKEYTTSDVVEVFQTLRTDVLEGWRSIHIACGAFDHTFMSDWFNLNQIPYTEIFPFEIQKLPIILHIIEGLNWSITKENSMEFKQIRWEYNNYVNSFCLENKCPPLALRNNSSKHSIKDEFKLKHNPHGLDKLKNYRAISLESALNPTQQYKGFLKNFFGVEGEKQLALRCSSYLFYQSLMRTNLRAQGNTDKCHVFVLDFKSAHALLEFVEIEKFVQIPTSYVSEQAKSRAEINRQNYLRRKQNSDHPSKRLIDGKSEIQPVDRIRSAVLAQMTRSNPQKSIAHETNEAKLHRLLGKMRSNNTKTT